MGSSNSVLLKNYPIQPLIRNDQASPYFVLVIRAPKWMVLFYSDTQIRSIINRRLRLECKYAQSEVIEKRMSDGTFQFPMKSVSDHSLSTDGMKNAQIFCRLLADLHTHGWRLAVSSDLNREHARSSMYFRRHPRDLRDASSRFLAILAGSSDVIRLIDVPEQLSSSLTSALENAPSSISAHLNIVCQEVRNAHSHESVEGRTRRFIELKVGDENLKLLLTKIILRIFSHLSENGYKFYGGVNMDGKSDLLVFEKSGAAPSPPPSEQFFSIDLINQNQLHVLNPPESFLRQTFMMAISNHYAHGMRHAISPWPECDIYQLNGKPWSTGGSTISQIEEALNTRKFLSALFELLHEKGWALCAAMQLDRIRGSTSTFIFCSNPSQTPQSNYSARVHRNAWSFAPISDSSIYLINAFYMHRGFFQRRVEDIRTVLKNRWRPGLAVPGDEDFRLRRFELNGSPWHASQPKLPFFQRSDDHGPNEDLHACALMCAILITLETRGHDLLCSASVTDKGDRDSDGVIQCKSDCDTWFWVERDRNEMGSWTPLASAESVARAMLSIREQEPGFDWEGRPIAGRAAPVVEEVSPSAPTMATAPSVDEQNDPHEGNPPAYADPPSYANVCPPSYGSVDQFQRRSKFERFGPRQHP